MFRLFGLGALPGALAAVVFLALASLHASAQETTTVAVGDTWFCDASFEGGNCETTVSAGDTVVWDFSGASLPHTTTGDGWDSDIIDDGSTFSFTFDAAGSYGYQCNVHPDQMAGTIIVEEGAGLDTPTDSDDDQQPPAGDTTDDAANGAESSADGVPATGSGPGGQGGANDWWIIVASLAGAGMSLAALGAYSFRRAR
jgi:hypothetical protein